MGSEIMIKYNRDVSYVNIQYISLIDHHLPLGIIHTFYFQEIISFMFLYLFNSTKTVHLHFSKFVIFLMFRF